MFDGRQVCWLALDHSQGNPGAVLEGAFGGEQLGQRELGFVVHRIRGQLRQDVARVGGPAERHGRADRAHPGPGDREDSARRCGRRDRWPARSHPPDRACRRRPASPSAGLGDGLGHRDRARGGRRRAPAEPGRCRPSRLRRRSADPRTPAAPVVGLNGRARPPMPSATLRRQRTPRAPPVAIGPRPRPGRRSPQVASRRCRCRPDARPAARSSPTSSTSASPTSHSVPSGNTEMNVADDRAQIGLADVIGMRPLAQHAAWRPAAPSRSRRTRG